MTRRFRQALAAAMSAAAGTAAATDFIDFAPVVAARPVIERVNLPRQECWNEAVSVAAPQGNDPPSPAGAVVGGIVGGVVGHQAGGGRGKDVATVAGAIAGALIGNSVANSERNASVVRTAPEERLMQRCGMVDSWQDAIRGYDVTYRYGGREATVRLPYDPGESVRVAVAVVTEPPPPPGYRPGPPRQ